MALNLVFHPGLPLLGPWVPRPGPSLPLITSCAHRWVLSAFHAYSGARTSHAARVAFFVCPTQRPSAYRWSTARLVAFGETQGKAASLQRSGGARPAPVNHDVKSVSLGGARCLRCAPTSRRVFPRTLWRRVPLRPTRTPRLRDCRIAGIQLSSQESPAPPPPLRRRSLSWVRRAQDGSGGQISA